MHYSCVQKTDDHGEMAILRTRYLLAAQDSFLKPVLFFLLTLVLFSRLQRSFHTQFFSSGGLERSFHTQFFLIIDFVCDITRNYVHTKQGLTGRFTPNFFHQGMLKSEIFIIYFNIGNMCMYHIQK